MKILSRVLFASALAILSASLLAANVVGTWKGKITIDSSKAPKPANPEQQKAVENGLAQVKKMVLTLNLKADKTYTVDASNVPGQTKNQKSEGTWKQDGNTVLLTEVKDNGKPTNDKQPKTLTILEGGKKLSLSAPGMPPFVKVTFTR